MSRQGTNGAARAVAAAVVLSTLLAACSDIYFDRRETVALGAEDAVAANMAEQTRDPWPPGSNDRNLTFNGERMQRAVECYRINKVTPPNDLNPSVTTGSATTTSNAACQGQMMTGSAQPASGAPVAAASAK